MKQLNEADLARARRYTLQNGSDVIHALGCLECDLQEDFLFVLAVLGWGEQEFLREYFTYLMGGRRG
jgi:hypothetical protein